MKGGDKLEAALREMAARVKSGTVRIGFLAGSTGSNNESIPLRAALNEFGHRMPNGAVVPPRPFFRNMIAANSPDWPEAIGDRLVANNYDVAKTLDEVGEAIKGQLQQSIRDLTSPPLAQSTIDRKGSGKPLIETGDMVKAVDHEVTK